MSIATQAFILNVGFIIKESIGYSRVFEFDIPEFKFDADFELEKIVGTITISRSSEGLLMQANFDASIKTVCVRCLDSFLQPLATTFIELYTFPSRAQEDTELIIPAEGKIDFSLLLREYMLLVMPISPICRESCEGICPECGTNLNQGKCNHESTSGDPRLAVLKQLLDKD